VFAWAEIQFPTLTGHVVDNANLLTPAEEKQITDLLAAHEAQTTNQLVVLTLADLGGYEIEDYGYQLGRHWAIGQKDKNNGALLIVAKQERKIRIEVGYGLEGVLTDAMSSIIIQREIKPAFQRGLMGDGIQQGVSAMVKLLNGEYRPAPAKKDKRKLPMAVNIFLFLMFFLVVGVLPRTRQHGFRGGYGGGGGFGGGYGGGGFGGGGFGGGGFGGGGGGFGGGGASGGW